MSLTQAKRRILHLLNQFPSFQKDELKREQTLDEKRKTLHHLKISIFVFKSCCVIVIALTATYLLKKLRVLYHVFRRKSSLSGVHKQTFSLIEPIIATAMLSGFSLIYNRVKESLILRLVHFEEDLMLHNIVYGLMQAFIRNNGNIPTEAIQVAMHRLNTYIRVHCKQIDEYIKLLEVTAYHPRSAEKITSKVLIPAHEGLSEYDSLKITIPENIRKLPQVD